MDASSDSRSERERQLDGLINEYYQAAEQGSPPDQAAFIEGHSEFAVELREFFADVGQMEGAVRQAAGAPNLAETQDGSDRSTTTLGPGSKVRYFGDYEILEELGIGGMGVVYKAQQQKLKRTVALKMIKVGKLAGPEEVRRFEAEARAAARLDHPGIVSVLEVGVHDGQHFFTMDYVAGGSLARLHRDQPVASRRAAELVRQLAEAVHYAHEQGIVHRDLKPANVLLSTSGQPRITDFGLAKHLWTEDSPDAVSMTETGQILGTAGYMSPEQAAGKSRLVGPPADIYALGAILYALLTSRAPFVGESQADTILQVLHKEPVSPRVLNPGVSRDLETICLKCLEKEPHKRYGTAQLLAEDLRRLFDGRPVLARPVGTLERGWRWCRRNPIVASLSAALALALALGTAVSTALAIAESVQRSVAEEASRKLGGTVSQLTVANEKLGEETRAKEEANQSLQGQLTENRRLSGNLLTTNETLEQAVYDSHLQLVQSHVEGHNYGAAIDLLTRHRPGPGQTDRRSFDWYYWWAQCHQEQREFDHLQGRRSTQEPLLISASPSGDVLATADRQGNVIIWQCANGEILGSFQLGHSSLGGICLSFDTDGQRLFAFGAHPAKFGWKRVLVWDVEERKQTSATSLELKLGEFLGPNVLFSPDGKHLICGAMLHDGPGARELAVPYLTIWDTSTGKLVSKWKPEGLPLLTPASYAARFALSRDGHYLAIGESGTISVWNIESHEQLGNVADLTSAGSVSAIDFASDGGVVVAGMQSGELVWWDWRAKAAPMRVTGHSASIIALRASGDGNIVASASEDQSLRVWRLNAKTPMAQFLGHRTRITDLALDRAGQTLLSIDLDGKAKAWSLAGATPVPDYSTLCLSPDLSKKVTQTQRSVFLVREPNGFPIGNRIEFSLVVNDIAAGPERSTFGKEGPRPPEPPTMQNAPPEAEGAWLSSDLRTLVTQHRSQVHTSSIWYVWDVDQRTLRFMVQGNTGSWAVSRDNRWLALTVRGEVVVYELDTGKKAASLRLRDEMGDKRRYDARVSDRDAEDQRRIPLEHVFAMAFVPDKPQLMLATNYSSSISASYQLAVKSWHFVDDPFAEPNSLWSWNELRSNSQTRRWWFSEDGERAINADLAGTARILDLAARRELATLRGHKHEVIAAAFCPDGRSVVTADKETLHAWSIATGEPTLRFAVPNCGRLKFSPDGRRLAGIVNSPTYGRGAARLWLGDTFQ